MELRGLGKASSAKPVHDPSDQIELLGLNRESGPLDRLARLEDLKEAWQRVLHGCRHTVEAQQVAGHSLGAQALHDLGGPPRRVMDPVRAQLRACPESQDQSRSLSQAVAGWVQDALAP